MDQKQYIGLQIKRFRTKANLTAEKLGELLEPKRSRNTITSWERGRTEPDGDTLIQLCVIFKAKISDFYFKDSCYEYAVVSLQKEDDGYVNVPVFGEIAAGKPIDMEEIDATFPIPKKLVDKYPKSGLLRVCGDSYNRTIPNGYFALVDFADKEPNERDPFAVCVNGYSATIKQVKKLSNGFELIPNSYDPTYLPIIYDYNKDDTDEVTIIGKVVWATMPFDYEI